MNKKAKDKILTPQEFAEGLGGEKVGEIPNFSIDPIGLKFMATHIGKRLSSQGGRPTDPSWKTIRKVPMKNETWKRLETIAEAYKEHAVSIAPGQLAGIALEYGLPQLTEQDEAPRALLENCLSQSTYTFPEHEMQEARELTSVAKQSGIW
ncbi:hypothetical protein GF373_11810 [bacterium]|nr:hypothetical protein [bacterium]